MKKILAILLTVALMVPCFAVTSYAAGTKVGSLHFKLNTAQITPGMEPDQIDNHSVTVQCTDVDHWDGSSGYNDGTKDPKYLIVRVTDLQCISPSTTFKVGDTVRIRFWVEVSTYTGGSQDYYINSATGIHVSADGGADGPKVKSVSKAKSGSELAVTVTLNPIKGMYSEPTNLRWQSGTLGMAQWSAPEDNNCTGYYDVKLMRDGTTIYTQNEYNATSLNLYPWMTREGDYSFAVRSITTTTGTGAKNSDWVESDSQNVPKEKISDGSGKGSGGSSSGKVGWQQVNGLWYYIYPDGTMKKNGWEKIQNLWYLFDAAGVMQTGWKVDKGNTYYLDPSKGDMKTGWINTSDGQWYWLNPNPQAGTEGAMWKNQFLDKDGYRYYLTSTGAMATGWTKIGNDQYYFRPQNDGHPKGSMVTNQRVDGFWLGSDGRWVKGQ